MEVNYEQVYNIEEAIEEAIEERITVELLRGFHNPVYAGNALVAMINSELLADITRDLPYARRGYILRSTVNMLAHIFFSKERVMHHHDAAHKHEHHDHHQHHDHVHKHFKAGPQSEHIFGEMQASFYPVEDDNGRFRKIPMAAAAQLNLAKGDLSTFGVLEATDSKFNRSHFKPFYLQKIIALNLFHEKDLMENPNLAIVLNAIRDIKVKEALIEEHYKVKKIVMVWMEEKMKEYRMHKEQHRLMKLKEVMIQPIEIRIPPGYQIPQGIQTPTSPGVMMMARSPARMTTQALTPIVLQTVQVRPSSPTIRPISPRVPTVPVVQSMSSPIIRPYIQTVRTMQPMSSPVMQPYVPTVPTMQPFNNFGSSPLNIPTIQLPQSNNSMISTPQLNNSMIPTIQSPQFNVPTIQSPQLNIPTRF